MSCKLNGLVLTALTVGYNVVAFNQTINKKIDPKTHVNILDGLLTQLRARPGVVFLKRLTIILDDDSEKGFGLVSTYLLTCVTFLIVKKGQRQHLPRRAV